MGNICYHLDWCSVSNCRRAKNTDVRTIDIWAAQSDLRLKALLKERVRVWVIIETVDLAPASSAIKPCCLGQSAIRIQTQELDG